METLPPTNLTNNVQAKPQVSSLIVEQNRNIGRQNITFIILTYLFGVIIFLGFGAAGIYVYQSHILGKAPILKKDSNDYESFSVPAPSPDVASFNTPMSALENSELLLKQYLNSKYGISFKYPSNWILQEDNNNYLSWDMAISLFSSNPDKTFPVVIGQIYLYKETVNGQKVSIDKYLTDLNDFQLSKMTINNYEVYRYKSKNDNKDTLQEGLLMTLKGQVFQIDFIVDTKQDYQQNVATIEQILNSFTIK